MPRRGERQRDFYHGEPELSVARIGVRQVVARDTSGVERVLPFDPAQFLCRTLANELADEWAEYIEVTGTRHSTARNYRQAMAAFCRFADGHLQHRSEKASMSREDPDLGLLLLAWEQWLPSRWPLGSTRPAVFASNIRTLINRRGQHPQREVAAGLKGIAEGQHTLHWGSATELDEYSRKDKAAMVRAAWEDIARITQRIENGRALAATGADPAVNGWLSLPNLLWAVANGTVTAREIAQNTPFPWPTELTSLLPPQVRNNSRRYFLIRALLQQLFPDQHDLHAFRVLLVAATGHAPEELTGLFEDDVEFTPGGVRLTLTKHRAKRIRRRAFRRITPAGTEEDVQRHADRPRLEVSEILRRLMELTAPLRERLDQQPAPLFLAATMSATHWQIIVRRFNAAAGPHASFKAWLERMGLEPQGRIDIRRLRKSTKVEKAIAFGGRITDIADDHHEETFRGHYAQGTTLRVVSGQVITAAQQSWFDKAVAGPVVLDAADALDDPVASSALAELGLSAGQVEELRNGALEMGVTSCRDPFDSPYSRPGELCAVAPLRCLECRNAWILPSHLPQLLLFADHLQGLRTRLSPVHFHTLWGQSAANLAAVINSRTEQEITTARRHIDEGSAALQLPLASRAEFDA
nr:hypothetical protein OG499_33395 [Streptomyces anulatus]